MNLEQLLNEVNEQNASDLHLVVGEPPVFRVNGTLIRRADTPVLDAPRIEALILPNLTETQRTVLSNGNDVERSITVGNRRYVFHVFRERGRLAAALRAVPLSVPTLDELGFTTEHHSVVRKLPELLRGLILVAGMPGNGKSTTVAALIEEINRTRSERIITIEDPIIYEFQSQHSVISQRIVGEDIPDYPAGLRAALREDSDVILIGELRDLETTMLALTLAETGHLVFSTIHASTATEAVRRLIEAFPEGHQPVVRRLVATNLQAVIVQQLIPRASKSGRVVAQEILLGYPRVRQMIMEGQFDMALAMEAGRDVGMRTMDDDLIRLMNEGAISRDMAWFRLQDKSRLNPPQT